MYYYHGGSNKNSDIDSPSDCKFMHAIYVVYNQTHLFGLGPVPKPKLKIKTFHSFKLGYSASKFKYIP